MLRSLGRFAEGTGYLEAVGCVDSALSLAGHRSIPSNGSSDRCGDTTYATPKDFWSVNVRHPIYCGCSRYNTNGFSPNIEDVSSEPVLVNTPRPLCWLHTFRHGGIRKNNRRGRLFRPPTCTFQPTPIFMGDKTSVPHPTEFDFLFYPFHPSTLQHSNPPKLSR